MTTVFVSIAVGVLTFSFGMLGLYLRRLLPEKHMSTGSEKMIGAIMGLVSLLLALVLGTLVGSAYGFFTTQKANIETLCARSLELDLAFRQYGAETLPLRDMLRASMTGAHEAIWGNGATYRQQFDVGTYMSRFEKWNEMITSLSPHTPAQTQLLSSMIASSSVYQQTRMSASLQLASPFSWPLLMIVVSWAMLLFCGFGVLSGLNPTSAAALALGSFAVASAIFLILEAQRALHRAIPHSRRIHGANPRGLGELAGWSTNGDNRRPLAVQCRRLVCRRLSLSIPRSRRRISTSEDSCPNWWSIRGPPLRYSGRVALLEFAPRWGKLCEISHIGIYLENSGSVLSEGLRMREPTATQDHALCFGLARAEATKQEPSVHRRILMLRIDYRTAEIGGVKISYREAGRSEGPTLLLMHGFPTAGHMFRDLIPLLADSFHLVAPTCRALVSRTCPRATSSNTHSITLLRRSAISPTLSGSNVSRSTSLITALP